VKTKNDTVVVVGLGYVGLPLAVAFAQSGMRVIGFDTNAEKIALYRKGQDPTGEVGASRLREVSIEFTADEARIGEGRHVIVAVPTPIGDNKSPDLDPVESASRIVGKNMGRGTTVIFESTVYPGVTQEVCLPILEAESGLKGGVDFKIGYSPERVNPGDKEHTVNTIVKVVSGMDAQTLDDVAALYGRIVRAGVHRAPTIRVAEAAKVIENAQRDINIAFMNELAVIFDRLGIDTRDVLAAAGTKWNFLKFWPGLVGGQCIGVDPYYLTYKSERNGYVSRLILAGRELNEYMSSFVVQKAVKMMIRNGIRVMGARVLILGLTFKENVPDLRNSKVADIVRELSEYQIQAMVCDSRAEPAEAMAEYNLALSDLRDIRDIDCLILAVAHDEYRQLSFEQLLGMFRPGQKPVLLDLKGILNKEAFENACDYYRL
jgi:UDP-N-acetyl-D-galactosamine dehydrogenase